jgi:Peptidase M61 N-terminal domain
MTRVRLAAVLVGLCLTAGPAAATDAAVAVEVDARDLPRKLLHTNLDIPCKPGPLRLWYPKWIPGSHGPYGRVEDVAGFRVETAAGAPVPWTRDEVELHCFIIKVPGGTGSVRVKLDTVCESAGPDAAGIYTAGTRDVGVINRNTCLVYPPGAEGRRPAGEGPTAAARRLEARQRAKGGIGEGQRWRHHIPARLAHHSGG